MSTPRPTKLSPEMMLAIGRKIAASLIKSSCLEEGDLEWAAEGIAKEGRSHQDGYALAKALDSFQGWDCNLEMAEELDNFSTECSRAIDEAQKEWAMRENITAPYPLQTRVKTHGKPGTIDRIYEYGAAKYCIAMDGEKIPTTRRIVNFEDVIPLVEESLICALSSP